MFLGGVYKIMDGEGSGGLKRAWIYKEDGCGGTAGYGNKDLGSEDHQIG